MLARARQLVRISNAHLCIDEVMLEVLATVVYETSCTGGS
jgi:hypothetical protein